MATAEFLDTALALGRRLARRALWRGKVCTWEVQVSQPDAENRTRAARAEGQLYQGTAGIAWFLGELYRVTGEAEVGRTARGGLEYALAEDHLPANLFGFHSGRVGIAWVAVRLAEIFQQSEYRDGAHDLLRPLAGQASLDQGLDVIAGAGGAIPACLDLAEKTGWDELRTLARELGERLLSQARRTPEGWSWASEGIGAVRNLTGLAHGASGMGLALLELARATGDGRFRFAAEMAFLYERRLFDEEASNWPDLRHTEIGESLFFEQFEELRQAVTAETLPPYRPKYMTAWCHGSPGIGLVRLRAWELTGQEVYRQEAEAALRSTLSAIEDDLSQGGNFSLCHGIGGNCELLLLATELLGKPQPRLVAERAAREGMATYEAGGRPWPCGITGNAPDPSLLLGEAGIGAFYLRLADSETPSPLLLRPRSGRDTSDKAASDIEQGKGFQELARQSVDDFFATTPRVWARLAPPGPALPSWQPDSVPIDRTPVEQAHATLVTCLQAEAGGRRQMLEDAFEPECLRYQLTLEFRDYNQPLLRDLVRPDWPEVDVQKAVFALAPGARLLTTRHDWPAWLATSDGENPQGRHGMKPPPESSVSYFFHREHQSIRCRQVGPMVALVLEVVERTACLEQIVVRVAEAVGLEQSDERLVAKVETQLRELYLAGFVDVSRLFI